MDNECGVSGLGIDHDQLMSDIQKVWDREPNMDEEFYPIGYANIGEDDHEPCFAMSWRGTVRMKRFYKVKICK